MLPILKEKAAQIRPSTLIQIEIEVEVVAKEVAKHEIKIMIRSSNSFTQVEEASLEAGGDKEDVVEDLDKSLYTIVTLNVIIVGREDISLGNVQRRRLITKMAKGSKITMCLLAGKMRSKVSIYL